MGVKELADKAHIDVSYVSRILNGRVIPPYRALARIVEVLGMTFEEHVILEALAGRVHPLIPPDQRIKMAQTIFRYEYASRKKSSGTIFSAS